MTMQSLTTIVGQAWTQSRARIRDDFRSPHFWVPFAVTLVLLLVHILVRPIEETDARHHYHELMTVGILVLLTYVAIARGLLPWLVVATAASITHIPLSAMMLSGFDLASVVIIIVAGAFGTGLIALVTEQGRKQREDLAREAARLAMLSEIVVAQETVDGPGQIVELAATRGKELVDAEVSCCVLLTEDRQRVEHFGADVADRSLFPPHPPQGKGLFSLILQEGQTLRLEDMTQHPAFQCYAGLAHGSVTSLLAVPIVASSGGGVTGALLAGNKAGGGSFSAEDERILGIYASHVAASIEKARLVEEIRVLAQLPEESPNLVVLTDAGGRVVYTNPVMRTFLREAGVPEREAEKVLPPDFQALLRQVVDEGAMFRGKEVAVAERWVSYSLTPFRGGAGVLIMGVDITERKRAEEALRLRTQELETLVRVAGILVETGTFQEKVTRVLEELARAGQVDRVVLRLPDEKEERMALVAAAGPGITAAPPLPFVLCGQGITGAAYQQGQPIVSNDYPSDPLAIPEVVPLGIKSTAALPIRAQDRVIGVVIVTSKDPEYFTAERVSFLTAVAGGMGVLIENARAEEALRLRTQELETLARVAGILVETGAFQEKVTRVLEEMARAAQLERVTLRVPDDKKQGLRLVAAVGPRVSVAQPPSFRPYGQGVSGLAFEQGQPVVVDDYPSHPQATPTIAALGVKSMVAVPIRARGRLVGTLTGDSMIPGHFTAERVSYLSAVADGMGVLIENARAEEALRESEERYRAVVDNASDAIVVSVGIKIVFANKAFLTLVGLEDMSQAMGMPIAEFVLPEDRQTVIERTLARQRGNPMPDLYEFRIRRADGEVRTVQTSTVLITYGGQSAALALLRDITERKRAEEAAREASRLMAVGELAAGVAHEINNPLTGVVGFIQLLMEQDLPDEGRRMAGTALGEAQRAAKVVSNLLAFARRVPPHKELININDAVRRVLELKSHDLQLSNIQVMDNLDPALPETMADFQQLQQVFVNIVANAHQAMQMAHGRGTLTVETRARGDVIQVLFTDDGPGIPRENLSRVFDPFFTTKLDQHGTGLGLSMALGIVKGHGGDIRAESVRGKGTTVTVELPLVSAEAEAVPGAEEDTEGKEVSRRAQASVLVVDDEAAIRELLALALGQAGLRVEVAASARAALDRLAESEFDLLVVDIRMPEMDGKELYREVSRRHPEMAKRVLFITGDTMSADTRLFVEQTDRKVVAKPFDLEEVIGAVRQVLEEAGG